MTEGAPNAAERLVEDRALLGRTSTAERVAAILRQRITEGMFEPGSRLSEESIGAALGVSRNTLREAFRLLSHERLLVHELNRGVFVRRLTAADVVDLYRLRRLIECAAIRDPRGVPEEAVAGLREGVRIAELAAAEERWEDVGTANMHFHRAIVELAGSPRLDEMMRQVLAELRLSFLAMKNPRAFHEPYLGRNRDILKLIEAGDTAGAERLLDSYLADAERQLVEAHS
ncbi:GntR family transcriptional regulator [Sphaerisporangium corydalis]|uniref:GntR family transcriptional regulator n=1 Tax=Sphaerisporangium corydalis TaxID=1441875 RepID=A0ABV9EP50_9ACTN|nr:GntR family transcriptional regulator [Sphaerisporangium corydalis]